MCMSAPNIPVEPATEPVPPPPPPPPPQLTAKGLTVGTKRQSAPKTFLRDSSSAKRTSPLEVPLGSTSSSAGDGINIPR